MNKISKIRFSYLTLAVFLFIFAGGCGEKKEKISEEKPVVRETVIDSYGLTGRKSAVNSLAIVGKSDEKALIIGTKDGLLRGEIGNKQEITADSFLPYSAKGLDGREINALLPAQQDILFIGSEMGISRLTPSGISTFDAGTVISLYQDKRDGTLWAGTLGHGAWHNSGDQMASGWTQISSKTAREWNNPEISSDIDRIYSFGFDGRDFWIGTGDGLLQSSGGSWRLHFGEHRRISMSGTITVNPGNSVLPGNRISAMVFDGQKNLYAGASGGIAEINPGFGISRVYTADKRVNETVDGRMQTITKSGNSQLVGAWVNALCLDDYGRLWIGTSSGLSVKDGENWHSISFAQGLISDKVSAIVMDGDYAWIGCDGGISRIFLPLEKTRN